MRGKWIVGVAGLTACRFGGPSADPPEYLAYPDAGDEVDSASFTGDDATVTSDDDDSEASSDDSSGDSPSLDASTSAACAQTVPVCDPVHNMGCNPFQQCDVDPNQKTPSGLCLFRSAAEAGPCTSTAFTESCPPKFTCVSATCKQLCFCNADCPTGQCCSDTSGPSGFTLCRPCP